TNQHNMTKHITQLPQQHATPTPHTTPNKPTTTYKTQKKTTCKQPNIKTYTNISLTIAQQNYIINGR
ncbi:hypothetical protein, partial [Methylobacterium sp. J-077]|uniref:hypothetical protein n=1 Tax=Methylobacterium sp. J-077 TaxID=2836656 RepID=UPI001FB948A1